MHAVFIPYGKKEWVDIFLRDIMAQKLPIKATTKDGKEFHTIIECQLRVLPGGMYEFVFPKEYKDLVLTTLDFHKPISYGLDKEIKILGMKFKPLDYVKKFLKLEDPGEFKTDNQFPWIKMFVSIIPLGVRYDRELTAEDGTIHEAI